MTLERNFQRRLVQDIKKRFPGCVVVKNDPTYIQGIPDLTVLHQDRWFMLEVKKDKASAAPSKLQPNQETYINRLNEMSYAAIVYPENAKEVLDAIQRSFQS